MFFFLMFFGLNFDCAYMRVLKCVHAWVSVTGQNCVCWSHCKFNGYVFINSMFNAKYSTSTKLRTFHYQNEATIKRNKRNGRMQWKKRNPFSYDQLLLNVRRNAMCRVAGHSTLNYLGQPPLKEMYCRFNTSFRPVLAPGVHKLPHTIDFFNGPYALLNVFG